MTKDSSTLTITVLDTATIYEGLESIFRYDLPGSGVVEGWALAGVMEQARKSAGPAWPNVEVKVLSDLTSTQVSEQAVTVIARQLRLTGVSVETNEPAGSPVYTSRTLDQSGAAAAEETTAMEATAEPFQPLTTADKAGKGIPLKLLAVGISLSVIVLVAVVGLLLLPKLGGKPQSVALPVESSRASTVASSPSQAGVEAAVSPDKEHVRTAGLEFDLPPGFGWQEKDGVITAVGKDPQLRVIISADPTFSVPSEELLKELRLQVDADPTLTAPSEQDGRFSYAEDPGDGSHISWVSWIEKENLYSVGCHSKQEATLIHKAACRMVAGSLRSSSTI